MPTLEEKLTRHFNILHSGLLHKNLCGFIGVNPTDDVITIYHDGSIRVGKIEYPADYSLSKFLREMEDSYQTLYSELKHVSDVLFGLQEKMKKISRRVDGNGHTSFYPEMLKKIFEGYADNLMGLASSVNAIANHTPSYGVTEEE